MNHRCNSFDRPAPPTAWLTVGAALFLLAWFSCLPSSAHAECGDYVKIGHPLAGSSATVESPASSSAPMPHAPVPCEGPSCSRNQAPFPVVPAAPRLVLSRESWADRACRDQEFPRESSSYPLPESDILGPDPLADRLDRPPR